MLHCAKSGLSRFCVRGESASRPRQQSFSAKIRSLDPGKYLFRISELTKAL
ncbi:hypothetical protein BSU04_12940 [Caballeronia sordidicola]|uniref:Uncharacterized protein n=1 Tax=Caballeronia sordidicola TaxID=196367 RepID=A0A226X454_CABSO|nr:hypothetical protein BSU04_12940 [Caballeronia sordidicola]